MQSPDTYHGHFAFFALAACLNERCGLWCVPKSCLTIHKTLSSLYRLNALWTAPDGCFSVNRENCEIQKVHTPRNNRSSDNWFGWTFPSALICLQSAIYKFIYDSSFHTPWQFFFSLRNLKSLFAHIQKSSRRASAVIALHVHSDTKNSLKQQSRAERV